MAFSALFGDTLIDNKGNKHNAEELSKNKAVGIYFSAHWCPPCRGFTPELAKAYTDNLKKKGLEIVFVSSDKDENAFKEYHGEMPWLALPFEKRDLKQKLSAKFKVQGIPTLVILDGANGALITKDGREAVGEDPTGENMPWRPKSFQQVIGDSFVDNKGNSFKYEDVKNKVIGLYFSAHWCPPCRGFTPQLVKTYNTLKADGKNFEVIFVSSDRDEHSFKEYHGEMPWLAVPFADRARKNDLSTLFGVQGIPMLVIVDGATGATINASGRGAVSADPAGKDFPWAPKPVNELSPATAMGLNEGTGLLVFVDNHDDQNVIKALNAAAKRYKEEKKNDDDSALSFYYAKTHDIVGRVKELMSYQPGAPILAILDIPSEGVFYSDIKKLEDITEDSVIQFVTDFKAGKVEKLPLSG